MLQKKYIGSYSQNARDYFSLLPAEKEIVEKLKNIYRNEEGIFILCGNRGSGKSSLKNISLEAVNYDKADKKVFVINVSFFSGNKDFHREILMQIPHAIEARIEEIKNGIGHLVSDNRNLYITPRYDEEEKEKEYGRSEMHQISVRLSTIQKKIDRIVLNNTTDIENVHRELSNHRKSVVEKFNGLNLQYGFQKKQIPSFKEFSEVRIKSFRREVKELEEKVEGVEKALDELKKLHEFLRLSQNQLRYFDTEITRIETYLESTTSTVSTKNSIDLSVDLGIVKLGTQLRGEDDSKKLEEQSQELKNIVTEELKERQLFRLLQNMSEFFNITFSIDELDKCSTATVINMIDKNKMLFFDCNVTTLLITDVATAISLSEESDYISEPNIVVVPDLTVLDHVYRVNSKGMNLSYDFIDILNYYFMSKMNNRELNYSRKYEGKSGFSKGFELYKFMNSYLYRDLNKLYQPIVLKFYWELIDLLDFVGELSKEEYEQFENSFFKKNDLHSLKVKFIVRKIITQLTAQSFEYAFILGDERSRYRHSKVLTEFNIKKGQVANFLEQLALKPTILSDDDNFLKINKRDCQTGGLYDFRHDLSQYLIELGFNDEIFRNILLELSKPKEKYISNNMKYRFADHQFYDPYQGIDDARSVVERENTVGVILFYPYDHSENADPTHRPLRNGIVVTVNNFDEAVLYPYLGYIGLHSHKPYYLADFKKELENQDIPIYEVEDENLWNKCFEQDGQELEDKIFKVCESKIKQWLDELRKVRS
ncbi:Uncharacterised protein [Streptococcus criceti]|uniref:KAP NTPase domain-containing protein n=1 Tax=Streptococcus criceti HS-6 TaxID=873449 RepID=G5JP52_STRCG|nr:P-loop NTPase fold protein [Streptococcus criceti]EHI73340.1 hypothetical protein STRCR_0284 [Streptococcus criceti HS-6]SUN41778.1 Uncharacterised protein [Streptococcus criceti]